MKGLKFAVSISVLALAGCASGGRCVGEFEYQKAETVTPIHSADGVKAPESASALRIPAPPKQSTQFAEHVPDPDKPGKQKVSCLDTPPVMAEPAPAAAAVVPQPAPAAPVAPAASAPGNTP